MDIYHPSKLYSTIYTEHEEVTAFQPYLLRRNEWPYTDQCNREGRLNETDSFVSSEMKYSQSCNMSYREFKTMDCWTGHISVGRNCNNRRRKSGLTAILANRRTPRDIVLCPSSGGPNDTSNNGRVPEVTTDSSTNSCQKQIKGDAQNERSKADIICKDTYNHLNYLRSKLTKQYPYERLSELYFRLR